MFLISSEGKTAKQLSKEVGAAYQNYRKVEQQVKPNFINNDLENLSKKAKGKEKHFENMFNIKTFQSILRPKKSQAPQNLNEELGRNKVKMLNSSLAHFNSHSKDVECP